MKVYCEYFSIEREKRILFIGMQEFRKRYAHVIQYDAKLEARLQAVHKWLYELQTDGYQLIDSFEREMLLLNSVHV